MPDERDSHTRPPVDICRQRRLIRVSGLVQGVGFRPFVYRLAQRLGLTGTVGNSHRGVVIDIEGPSAALDRFVEHLQTDLPPLASIDRLDVEEQSLRNYTEFIIQASDNRGRIETLILPDIATCPDCRREIMDVADRRHRYPFTNCTNCGPRFSIIERMPYDRQHTTMKRFTMCPKCRAEYDNPLDRRFHAQPNACPECGPHLKLWDSGGNCRSEGDQALREAEEAIRDGRIVALKGLGGFQLLVDARNEDAVIRLRRRKARPDKPLAIMMPSLAAVREVCAVSSAEEKLLASIRAPIVLLQRRPETSSGLAAAVAPGNPYLGVMLPYTPLHHLLLFDLRIPIVATSGNLSDEPICTDEGEALERLAGIADLFLVHDRPIARHVDDSVARILPHGEQVIRCARGYAPLPMAGDFQGDLLAVGGHLKNSVAVASGGRLYLSQHIGDLDTIQANQALAATVASLTDLLECHPEKVIGDLHPDYGSTRYAQKLPLPFVSVQHHFAHVFSGLLDHRIAPPVLGISWDGTGLGDDGTIWGGEFIHIGQNSQSRVAHLKTFRLPGGEQAIVEPRRSALGVLYEIYGGGLVDLKAPLLTAGFKPGELADITRLLTDNINCVVTSSAGRLFDAVAALLGLRSTVTFEGQAAMELEFLADNPIGGSYRYSIDYSVSPYIIDWRPMIEDIMVEIEKGLPAAAVAGRFHATLAEIIAAVAEQVGEKRVILTGGCFQNALLTRLAVAALEGNGLIALCHRMIPPNDGGIAAGQIAAACFRPTEEN